MTKDMRRDQIGIESSDKDALALFEGEDERIVNDFLEMIRPFFLTYSRLSSALEDLDDPTTMKVVMSEKLVAQTQFTQAISSMELAVRFAEGLDDIEKSSFFSEIAEPTTSSTSS